MKYSEFKQRVIDIGFTVEDEAREVWVVDDEGDIVAAVSPDITNSMATDYTTFKEQDEDVRAEVLRLTYQLAKTPLAEREEEKLYRVKFPNIKRSGLPIILTKVNWDGSGYTTMDWPCESYAEKHPEQFTFTEQEIKDIDERYLAFKVEVTPE